MFWMEKESEVSKKGRQEIWRRTFNRPYPAFHMAELPVQLGGCQKVKYKSISAYVLYNI